MDRATVEKRARIHTKFQEGIIFGWCFSDAPRRRRAASSGAGGERDFS